ncbi:MAG: TetR/AcrR family transcriptional regulator [Caldilinea sp. CFX5]|nr:TetR/AcrR family transcriptional regulator [Caldilinea sp. CFX5]
MRRLALLWGSQSEEGRSGLTIKAIVAAALTIADEQGLTALSMRAVADRLDAGVMSLYTYIPSKEMLLDLMIDSACSEVYASVDEPSQQPGGWLGALRFIAQRNWDLYQKHPWLLQANTGRPVIGPHTSRKYEAELRPLDGIGLTDVEMDATLTLVLTHVEGCARTLANLMRTQQDSGMTDSEWWVTQAPLLDKLIDPVHFPVATRVGTAAGEEFQATANPHYLFTFGLERILAGVAELVANKR